jgi:signal peptidase II
MAWKLEQKRILWVLLIVVANIILDQWTKHLALQHLAGQGTFSYLGDTFRLLYVENKGAFLSLGAGQSEVVRHWVLKIMPIILLAGLLVYTLFSDQLTRIQYIAFSFILGGGISNVYDRLLYNQVGDFMNMGIGTLRTGIFNMADVSIMFGLGIMIWNLIRQPKKAS